MSLNDYEQIKQQIADKKHILVTFRADGRGDAIGSATALAQLLSDLGKRVDVVVSNFSLPTAYHFLKTAREIKAQPGHLQKFVVTVDVKNTGVGELSYDVKDDQLRIFITPKNGYLTKDQIRTATSDFTYDLIIVVDTPELASLHELYEQNTDFFFRTPIINIDHHTTNEHFGHLNLVDVTMSTTAELLLALMQKNWPEFISADIATSLLTGMMAGTNSFKKNTVRPQTLAAASELVNLGADRAYVVKNIFQTKSIATFRLWGAALSKLQHDPLHALVWTTITREDFTRSGANEGDLYAIIDELISSAPAAKLILILHEHADVNHQVHGILQTVVGYNALELLAPFSPRGEKNTATFTLAEMSSLRAAETKVLEHLRAHVTHEE